MEYVMIFVVGLIGGIIGCLISNKITKDSNILKQIKRLDKKIKTCEKIGGYNMEELLIEKMILDRELYSMKDNTNTQSKISKNGNKK